MRILKTIIPLFIFLVTSINIDAQYSNKKVKSKHQTYTDSLKSIDYDRILPILGRGAYKQGFDIPYPVGVMANFIWMNQGVTIDNLQLGLKTDNNDIPLTEVDFIEFGDNQNTSFSTNFRPDIWILPFINVYGLFGVGRTKTEVELVAPVNLVSVVDQGLTTTGFGILGAGGVGPVWISVDVNFTWNKPELLEEATQVNVVGLRIGHSFVFKHKPYRNINIWAGAMRVSMNTKTTGAISLYDALPQETWDRKDEIVADYDAWKIENYNDLSLQQKLTVDNVIDPIVDRIDNLDGGAVISYSMDKQTKELWNGILGAQFQFNKAWQLRSEVGFIGDRKSVLVSINYRVLGPKRKM